MNVILCSFIELYPLRSDFPIGHFVDYNCVIISLDNFSIVGSSLQSWSLNQMTIF